MPFLKQPNLSARIGVNFFVGRCWCHFEAAKPVSQDWGKFVVGRCWYHFEPNLSARIGVNLLFGGAGVILKQPNLSARIG